MACDKVAIYDLNLKKLAQKNQISEGVVKEKKNPSANPACALAQQFIALKPSRVKINLFNKEK